MNFAGVKSIAIPEGDVKSIAIGGVTVWTKPNPLPYDAEVEYVESTGAQYVDTGVLATDATGVRVDVSAISTNQTVAQIFFGVFGSDNRYGIGLRARPSNIPFAWWNVANANSQTINYADVSVVSLNYLNSRAFAFGSEWSGVIAETYNASNTEIRIFNAKRMDNGQNAFTPGAAYRLHSMLISVDSTLVRSFVPVRVGTAGYLFDRANPTGGPLGNGLYGSATSTPLVAGPDKNGG